MPALVPSTGLTLGCLGLHMPGTCLLACAGAHGAPIHWGSPEALGISESDLSAPHWGEAVSINEGEVPVFWACGVTPHTAIMAAKLPLAITHAPGHM
jgi:uncharacterized protein YcsI (UPF0317 family)